MNPLNDIIILGIPHFFWLGCHTIFFLNDHIIKILPRNSDPWSDVITASYKQPDTKDGVSQNLM